MDIQAASPENVSDKDVMSNSPEALTPPSVSGTDSEGSDEDEDSNEDSGDESDDDDDDDDEEPALKYERLSTVAYLFKKDTASALVVSNKTMALGTHAGFIHMLDARGNRSKTYHPHQASVLDLCMDVTGDWVASASMDGWVVIHSLSTPESYQFDMKRSMRTVALEPQFARKSTRSFVCGGMAGELILKEKGWLGHSDTVLSTGEGPIWCVRWRDRCIAWANEKGVKIYDTVSKYRLSAVVDRPSDSPRAELYKCNLYWQDDTTLIIAWASLVKIVRIRSRTPAPPTGSPLIAEVKNNIDLGTMIAGLAPFYSPGQDISSLLLLTYTPPKVEGPKRSNAERPELVIITRAAKELSTDAITVTDFERWGCNDYVLAEFADDEDKGFIVLSPRDLIIVRPRDKRDHIEWLVERQMYAEALDEADKLGQAGLAEHNAINTLDIGKRYMDYLITGGDFVRAAQLCPRVCGSDVKLWEDYIWKFAQKRQLQVIVPYIPTSSPRLGHLIYEMILGHLLLNDQQMLLSLIKEWPKDIYDLSVIIVAVQSQLDRAASSSKGAVGASSTVLMECLAELYTANRQPGKALPFFLRLRRSNVFDLIRDHNLFTDVRDQVLLLVEFDRELMEKRAQEGWEGGNERSSDAIQLLVDHVHSIPVGRVVAQLQSRPRYLFMYLDSLTRKDPHLTSEFADQQVELCAEYAPGQLLDFLRVSSNYNLEKAYAVCKDKDLVGEMVFLLGRMGDNKKALTLIIERLGDVNRAIDFAKEQSDDDLWEDLLRYSETRPNFIRGLLENVGAEIDPKRVIRRIKNGLEIPGLKEALIKILQDFHLQISLMEGCQTILFGDSNDLSRRLQKDQESGFFTTTKSICPVCHLPLLESPQSLVLLFLCRHSVHSRCVAGGDEIPALPDPILVNVGLGNPNTGRGISGKIAYAAVVRSKLEHGCPVCHSDTEGGGLKF